MSAELKQIQQILAAKAEKKNKDFFSVMVPGQSKMYGVKTPVLNELAKQYRKHSFMLAEELWQAGALEERIIAIKILEKTGKDDPKKLMTLFKKFSTEADNWAVCDGLGMQFLRGIVKTHTAEIFALAEKFNRSENMWQRRLSLVMVEWYTRDKQYIPAIKKLVTGLANDDEYYVKKAVTWINRNIAKGK